MILFGSCNKEQNKPTSNGKTLRIAMAGNPTSFDPHQARGLLASTLMPMMFEGLTRLNEKGEAVPAVAEDVSISEDGLTYIFSLRNCQWSNGDPVTAYDFEYAWKRVLSPSFPAPYAFRLFFIAGAKAAKNGDIAIDDIGVAALDANTLAVHLETPTPQFLEHLSFHAYFPINRAWDQEHPNWAKDSEEMFVGNGPFLITRPGQDQLNMLKNPLYWDADTVQLDAIEMISVDDNTAQQLFENGDLDWVGSPMGTITQDAIIALKDDPAFKTCPAAGTQFFRFNTRLEPFDNIKFRKAFSFALNRQDIVDHILQAGQKPALALVPPTMGVANHAFFTDNDSKKARELFEEGLEEMGWTRETMPKIALTYFKNDRYHKVAQAVQQQFLQVLGINVVLRQKESKIVYDMLQNGDYQFAIGSWFADINDPTNFLEVFKNADNGTNNTGWENPQYISYLNDAIWTDDDHTRSELYYKAEKLLMEEMPIAPINYFTFVYLSRPHVKGVMFSQLGFLDFKNASVEVR